MENLVEVLANRGRVVEMGTDSDGAVDLRNKVAVLKDMVGVMADLKAAGFAVEEAPLSNVLMVSK